MAKELKKIETFVFNESQLKDLQKSPELLDLMKKADTMVVNSHDDSAVAITVGAQLSKFVKWVNGKRLEVTRPFDQKKKEIKACVDEFLADIIAAENKIKKTNYAFVQAEQERVAEATRKAEAEEARRLNISLAQNGDGKNIKPVAKPVPVSVVNPTKVRKTLKFDVVDEAKVPRKFLAVDTMEINSAVMYELKELRKGRKAGEEVEIAELTQIPGIKFYWKETPVY